MIFADKSAAQIREMWQAKVLVGTTGLERAILIRMFVKAYRDDIKPLLRAIGIAGLKPPQIFSHAKIAPSGKVIADVLEKNGGVRTHILYDSQARMRADFGRLADRLKLDDISRVELFDMLQRFVVADLRIDAHGRRLAS